MPYALTAPESLRELVAGRHLHSQRRANCVPYALKAPESLHDLLGVDQGASAAEVKRAYRAQMARLHPDVAGQRATGVAALLNLAYYTLSAQAEQGANFFVLLQRGAGAFDAC